MLHSRLDHIAVTAPSLAVGVEYVRQTLGVTPQVGGEHPRMGTHNYFLKLGEKVYLEVISINPDAPSPDRPDGFSSMSPIRTKPFDWQPGSLEQTTYKRRYQLCRYF